MRSVRLLAGLALASTLGREAAAQPYTFDVQYFGAGVASLAGGSDDPVGLALMPGDSFRWTIQAMNSAYWHVFDGTNGFFPLMAFGLDESGTRTGDFTLTLSRLGAPVFSFAAVGSVQSYVHLGTNTINLATGLNFDHMQLDYALTDAYENDPNDPQPSGPPTASTPTGILPIFGAPEQNAFFPGIAYVTTSAVPEPGTYALVLGGLAMLGVVSRRRGRAAS